MFLVADEMYAEFSESMDDEDVTGEGPKLHFLQPAPMNQYVIVTLTCNFNLSRANLSFCLQFAWKVSSLVHRLANMHHLYNQVHDANPVLLQQCSHYLKSEITFT